MGRFESSRIFFDLRDHFLEFSATVCLVDVCHDARSNERRAAAGVGSVGARHPRASCVNTLTNHRTRGARGRRARVHERMNRVHLAHQVVVEAWC